MISSSYSSTRQISQRLLKIVILVSILFIVGGFVATIATGRRIDTTERERLIVRAQNASVAIDPAQILALSGSPSDIGTPLYESLKADMMKLHAINPDSRFVYLMGLRNDTLFFFVDSEAVDSKDYSPPGQVYTETTSYEVENYKKGNAFAEGPYQDRWGSWVSAYAPVIDPATGQTIAIIGIDISADYWNHQIILTRFLIGALTILLCAFFITLVFTLQKSTATSDVLYKENESLRASKEFLSEAETIAHLGRFNYNTKTNQMSWSKEMYSLFGIPSMAKITPEIFFNAIHPDDVKRVHFTFDQALENGHPFECMYRILLPHGTEKTILSRGSIHEDQGVRHSILGTAQDITAYVVKS